MSESKAPLQLVLKLETVVCWQALIKILTMVAAPRGSAILDGQELGGRCGYVICEHATWCWSEGDERSGSGLVQQYYNAHSWSILDDGTDTWVPEIASNDSGDLVWCLLGRDVHQSLHCLCDHSYLQLN